MELLLILLALYLFEGLLWLPPRTTAFPCTCGGMRAHVRTGRDAAISSLPLRPGALSVFAAPPPLALDDAGVRSTAPLGALGLPAARAAAERIEFEAAAFAEAAGGRVRVPGTSLLRATSRRHARDLAALLREIGSIGAEQRHAVCAAALARSVDVEALRERVHTSRRVLRTTTWFCDAYAAAFLALVPVLLFAPGVTPLLWAFLGVLTALHCVTLACAVAAQRALLPADVVGRREALLAAAIYPPSLLRLPQRVFLEAVGVPLPATAAAALLEGEARSTFLRRIVALADHDPEEMPGEHAALSLALARVGLDPAVLRSAPQRNSALETAWCPRCLEGFRSGVLRCTECDVALRLYAS